MVKQYASMAEAVADMLETRTCECPCKRTWRCLPSSKDKFYSQLECRGKWFSDRLEFGDQAPRKERKKRRQWSKWDG